tara:strand:- start:5 stop:253 length:249 start_codon:yes stop_codon:yes gene_type:complete
MHDDYNYMMKNKKGERCLFAVLPERNMEQVRIFDESWPQKDDILHIHDARKEWNAKIENGWEPFSHNWRDTQEVMINVTNNC